MRDNIFEILTTISDRFIGVLTHPEFWFKSLGFIVLFLITLRIFFEPLKKFSTNWPIVGAANLIFLLIFPINIIYFFNYSGGIIIPSLAIGLLVEYILFKKIKYIKNREPEINLKKIIIFISLFFILTSAFYDYNVRSFFIPGYEVSHDPINILTSAKVLLENPQTTNSNLERASDLMTIYPLGGISLLIFFSQMFVTDIYDIYPLLLAAMALLVIFCFKKLNTLALIATVFSFVYISSINAGFLASSIVVPFTAYAMLNMQKQNYIILFLIFTANIFLYGYFNLMYIFVFIYYLFLQSNNKKMFIFKYLKILSIMLIAGFVNFHFILSGYNMLLRNLFSSNRELSLFLGAYGNQNSFLHILKVFSFWFSHNNYLVNIIKPFNYLLYLIIMFAFFFTKKNRYPKKYIAIFMTFATMLVVTRYITNSPYQFFKVAQFFVVFLPYLITKYIKSNVYKNIIFMTMIASGFLAWTFTGKSVVESRNALASNNIEICHIADTNLLVLSRDEWSRYFLQNCKNPDFFFDRRQKANLLEINKINNLDALSQDCKPNSLALPKINYIKYNHVLIDNCFSLNDNFEFVSKYGIYNLYKIN